MAHDVRCCVLCRSDEITIDADDRFVTTSCRSCGAVVRIEFDPPDDPTIRGRIEVLIDPADTPARKTRTRRSDTVH